MKKYFLVIASSLFILTACGDGEGEYVDLNTGKKITVVKDEEKGYMVDADTKRPVYLYTDPVKRDTFYGRTGKRVNNEVERNDNGMFMYTGDDDYLYKNGDYKLKAEEDGEYKIKDGDYKLKVEEDGDMKVKNDDYKKKVEEDGDIKIKDGDTKIKVEDGKVTTKKND